MADDLRTTWTQGNQLTGLSQPSAETASFRRSNNHIYWRTRKPFSGFQIQSAGKVDTVSGNSTPIDGYFIPVGGLNRTVSGQIRTISGFTPSQVALRQRFRHVDFSNDLEEIKRKKQIKIQRQMIFLSFFFFDQISRLQANIPSARAR